MTNVLWGPIAWLAVAGVCALLAPGVAPLDATIHPVGEAVAAGVITGLALFLVLARRRPSPTITLAPRRRLVARSLVLAAKSTQEEALWRGIVLGGLVAPLGRLGALVASTALFAAAHVPRQAGAARAHLVTGTAFGGVYLLTGRLTAAVAAHAAYNALVGASLLAEPVSVSDTGARRVAVVPSERPLRLTEQMPEPGSTPQWPVVARLERVSKSFRATSALIDVDLELRRGEILALLGPNGAGKSTAVAIMLGLRRPDTGRATLFGADPRAPASRQRIGAVLQDVSFPPGLRVRDAVDLASAHFPHVETTPQALSRLGLESHAARDAGGLSGGERRRLAVALALLGRPRALFLDEPTAGMDANARRGLLTEIVRFAGDGGAVLLTTQQLAEAEEIASRVVLLTGGRIKAEGTVAEMRARAGLVRVTFRAPSPPPDEGVVSGRANGDRHVVFVEDADAYVSRLVHSGTPFSQLEIARSSLEDAFVALTGDAVE